MKYEYKILNLSEIEQAIKVDKRVNLLTVFNQLGADRWEYCGKIKATSFLFKRTI